MNALTQSAMPASTAATVPLLRTLVLCDLVDSTALVERLGDQRAAELIRKHDRVVRALLPMRGGREIDKTDGFLAMFDRPIQAVAFALDYQRGLRELNANEKTSLGARVGIHVGDVVTWDNTPDDIAKGAKLTEVEGLVKPITSRLMQLALPGQILLSGVAFSLAHRAQGELGERLSTVRWRTHGRYRFKGIPDPIPVFEVGEEGHAPLKPPPWSGKAHREVPFWRRPATVVVEGALVLALVAIPLWYVFKPAPAIAFANRDWVVVGDLKNLTGQASFDESLETAFRIGLEQSRYVNVLSDLKTRETVKLMQRDPEQTQIDRAVGSEVAIRDGARALILPTVAEIGGRVRVTAEVIDPQTQTTVYSESADGVGEGSVLPSLDKVNQQLRVRLGEALATVSNESKPLDKVATKNLDALRAYTLGQRAYETGDMKEALSLFQQAVKFDPSFALARLMCAQTYGNAGDDESALKEITAASALKDKLPQREAIYVDVVRLQFEAPNLVTEKVQMLAKLYPDFFPAHGLSGYLLWQNANRYGDAIKATQKSASAYNAYRNASEYLLGALYLGEERHDEALTHFAEADSLGFARGGLPAAAHAASRNFDKVDAALARDKSSGLTSADVTDQNLRLAFDADRGKWTELWAKLTSYDQQAEREGSKKNARELRAAEIGLRALAGKSGNAALIKDYLTTESPVLANYPPSSRAEAVFRILFVGYLAARSGDAELARTALASAGTHTAGFPVLINMRIVLEAQIALADGHAQDADRLLRSQALDGSELYLTHAALLDVYAAKGDHAAALEQARWLTGHRGRAYSEYNADWVARPFNVVLSDLAFLQVAQQSAAIGNKTQARQALHDFHAAWPDTADAAFVEIPLKKLEAELQ